MFEDQKTWFKNLMKKKVNDKTSIKLGLMKFSLLFISPNYKGML